MVKIAGFYHVGSENPYCKLFYNALSSNGVQTIYGESFNDRWILTQKGSIDWLHVHWPEGFWRYSQRQVGGGFRGLFAFWLLLRKVRRQGFSLAWTVHNLSHHEGTSAIDRLGYKLLYQYCDLLICHSEHTKNEILQGWHPKAKIVVMPHGNYDGVYPEADVKELILEELGLHPDIPVVSCIGVMRNYKGLDIAVQAALRAQGEYQLLIAGKPHPEFPLDDLLAAAATNKNIVVVPESLSEKQFSNMYKVTDVALLPYRNVTGSGALLTALTFGCGVVSSDLPYFREIIGDQPNAGMLFKIGDSQSLRHAIKEYLAIPSETRHQAALDLANIFAWSNVVKPVADAFKER
jgi:glycosyltransferase involved in cell wall biosynthesis